MEKVAEQADLQNCGLMLLVLPQLLSQLVEVEAVACTMVIAPVAIPQVLADSVQPVVAKAQTILRITLVALAVSDPAGT
jgi:hypothetical protein